MLSDQSLIVIANWKMHPDHLSVAKDLCNFYLTECARSKIELVLAPPAIYLLPLIEMAKEVGGKLNFSAQTVAASDLGAFTGQLAARMFKNLGCKYAILGHSECRRDLKHTDHIIADQLNLVIAAELIPILCIGEAQSIFAQGSKAVEEFLAKQLDPIWQNLNKLNFKEKILIAYEPIWAIGTKVIPDLEYIQRIINYVYTIICANTALTKQQVKILYGGSVNLSNIKKLSELSELAGVLVGAASLEEGQFFKMCQALENL